MTEAVRRRPYAVILFDEIEKAHPDVYNVLLQMLDDGRLTDAKGRVVNFKNTIIIMTSNMGAHIFQEALEALKGEDKLFPPDSEIFAALETAKVQVLEVIKKMLKPEFFNRIDEVITFKPLQTKEIHQIVSLQLQNLKKQLAERDIYIDFSEELIDYFGKEGFDPQYGARPLKRLITRELINELSKMLLSDKVEKGKPIVADIFEDQVVFRNKV